MVLSFVAFSSIIPHIWREIQAARIPGDHVTGEGFLSVHLESIQRRENDDFVVHALTCEPLLVARRCYSWHGMHRRIGDIFHVNWNVPVQRKKSFIITD